MGVCVACHKDLPDGTITLAMFNSLGRMLGQIPTTDQQHQTLISRTMHLAATVEILGPIVVFVVILVAVGWLWMRRRKKAA